LTHRTDLGTFSDVPSENVDTSTDPASEPMDRRARKRAARRDHLLDLAADLVERDGIEGLTMAALADAADYATASLYTYFPSRSALLAALQQRALHTLGRVAEEHVASWDGALDAADEPVAAPIAALARLWAFSDLFLAAPDRYPHEFRLQQRLLVTPDGEDTEDAATVVPAAMGVLDVPRRLLAAAVDAGALAEHPPVLDPLGQPLDGALVRTLAWVVALNGALLTDGLTTGLPATGAAIGRELTASLLRGWGADPADLTTARDLAAAWAR
jgi:AcrR family transcriptional regulator